MDLNQSEAALSLSFLFLSNFFFPVLSNCFKCQRDRIKTLQMSLNQTVSSFKTDKPTRSRRSTSERCGCHRCVLMFWRWTTPKLLMVAVSRTPKVRQNTSFSSSQLSNVLKQIFACWLINSWSASGELVDGSSSACRVSQQRAEKWPENPSVTCS